MYLELNTIATNCQVLFFPISPYSLKIYLDFLFWNEATLTLELKVLFLIPILIPVVPILIYNALLIGILIDGIIILFPYKKNKGGFPPLPYSPSVSVVIPDFASLASRSASISSSLKLSKNLA